MENFTIKVIELKNGEKTIKDVTLQTKGKSIAIKEVAINKYLKSCYGNFTCICGVCTNGPSTCPKMADITFRMIDDYPFVTEGFQVQCFYVDSESTSYSEDNFSTCAYERETRNNNLGIKRFIVRKCEKFTTKR